MPDDRINKFAFIILNYGAAEETQRCVASIKKHISGESYEIIIVDNNSPDHSGKLILKQYDKDPGIHVIINKSNLGFARGHNVGFRYAKGELGCDCIVLLNNDTQIVQDNFLDLIREEYEATGCDVIGPSILNEGKMTDRNPGRDRPFDKRRLAFLILFYRILLCLNRLYLDQIPENIFQKYVSQKKKKAVQTRTENVALYGCCLILTPEFVRSREGLNPNTFMYMEEDILYEEVMKRGGRTVYLPELMIEHKEAVSTDRYHGNDREKRRFIYLHTLESAKVLASIR